MFGLLLPFLNGTWRIIPFSKWFIAMVSKSLVPGVVGPLPNGLFLAYKWGLLSTY